MSDNTIPELHLKLLEWAGWKPERLAPDPADDIPRLTLDLLHEWESKLTGPQAANYTAELSRLCYAGTNHCPWFLLRASIDHRTIALARTLGLMEDK